MNNQVKFTSMGRIGPIVQEAVQNGQTVRLIITGNSMFPMLRHGIDSVCLSAISSPLKKYDLPLYRRQSGDYVVHRIVNKKDGCYTMAGDHQQQLETPLYDDQMVAIVSGFYRRERYYSCRNPLYWLYARVWTWCLPHRSILLRGLKKVWGALPFGKVKRVGGNSL